MSATDLFPRAQHAQPKANAGVGYTPDAGRLQYLTMYNALNGVLWASFIPKLGGPVLFFWSRRPVLSSCWHPSTLTGVFEQTAPYLRWTQTIAILEVAHAAARLVRAPVLTTGLQVASRLFMVWGILWLLGSEQGFLLGTENWDLKVYNSSARETTIYRNLLAYAGMSLAWAATEMIRYLYFVLSLGTQARQELVDPGSARQGEHVPWIVVWLRYNMFFVLYPVGIVCECRLVYGALPAAREKLGTWAYLGLWLVLAIYVPGSYVLYTHMMAQRRKLQTPKDKGKAKIKA